MYIDNVADMNHEKYLNTSVKQYLEQAEDRKRAILSYKYSHGMRSSYGHNFSPNRSQGRTKAFILQNERNKVKVPYKPPRDFVTTKDVNHCDTRGTGMIGAMTIDGKGYHRRKPEKGELEGRIPAQFANQSFNQMAFGT